MMLNINENNMNQMITMQEAQEILKYAKRLYPGQLDGITINHENSFSYCRDEYGHYITIPTKYHDEEIMEIGTKILSYINEEFNSNFALNLKTISINAFCHEIGHCIDFANKRIVDEEYEWDCDMQYFEFRERAADTGKYIEYLEYLMYCEEHGIEDEEEEERIFEEQMRAFGYSYQEEIDDLIDDLDHSYRQITSEYHADEFSAEFMNTYMRHLNIFNK